MLQEVFRIPILNIPVYGYGLMLVLAFLACTQLAQFLARRTGQNPEVFVNGALIAMISGVVGSRLSHILENLGDYTRTDISLWQNLINMVNIRSGGLTFYGGLLLAFPAVSAFMIWKKIPFKLAMDIHAPAVMLGLAIGRIGCFLNGCCYGAECNVPWAVEFPYGSNAYVEAVDRGEIKPPEVLKLHFTDGGFRLLHPREIKSGYVEGTKPPMPINAGAREAAAGQHSEPVHPAQLYSTITSLLICGILVAYFFQPHVPGRVMALMLILEGPSRYLLEMLRVEPPVIHVAGAGLSFSMVLAVGLFVAGIVMWFALRGERSMPTELAIAK